MRVIIAAMWRADGMFRCARQEFGSSAPLSSPRKEERGTDEKLTLFNHIFFFPLPQPLRLSLSFRDVSHSLPFLCFSDEKEGGRWEALPVDALQTHGNASSNICT